LAATAGYGIKGTFCKLVKKDKVAYSVITSAAVNRNLIPTL